MSLVIHGGGDDRRAWVIASEPTGAEREQLRELGFDERVLAHVLDPDERPRLRVDGDTTLIVLRAPIFQGHAADVPYRTVAVGIVLGPETALTACAKPCDVIDRFAKHAEREADKDPLFHHMVVRALELTAEDYLRRLSEINRIVDGLEDRLEASMENREVLELLKYQKSLVYFTAALCDMRGLIERMAKTKLFELPEGEADWLEDVLAEFRQATDTSTMSRDVMANMMDAFASIISNNLNVVMKFMASATVILTFPMIATSIYGMNVDLPFQRSPTAYMLVLGASIAVAGIVAAYFRWRRWI